MVTFGGANMLYYHKNFFYHEVTGGQWSLNFVDLYYGDQVVSNPTKTVATLTSDTYFISLPSAMFTSLTENWVGWTC